MTQYEKELKKKNHLLRTIEDQMWGEYLKRGSNVTAQYWKKQAKADLLRKEITLLIQLIKSQEEVASCNE